MHVFLTIYNHMKFQDLWGKIRSFLSIQMSITLQFCMLYYSSFRYASFCFDNSWTHNVEAEAHFLLVVM
jgi:hypothetical protein